MIDGLEAKVKKVMVKNNGKATLKRCNFLTVIKPYSCDGLFREEVKDTFAPNLDIYTVTK